MLSCIMEFFGDVCFSFFFAVFVSFCLFSGKNFISSNKDAAATTAVVELIIRTGTVSLLLALAIVYYSRELPIQ